jgi:hypothetical protein
MLRRYLVVMLTGVLLLTASGFQHVRAQGASDTKGIEKTRAKVQKIGVGGSTRVEVRLRDNTQLKGFISEASQDSFTVVDTKTGASRIVSYADTSSVNKASGGLSMKSWIIIGAAVAGAAITWVAVKPVLCDGGAQSRGPC